MNTSKPSVIVTQTLPTPAKKNATENQKLQLYSKHITSITSKIIYAKKNLKP